MTVKELIAQLKTHDPDHTVVTGVPLKNGLIEYVDPFLLPFATDQILIMPNLK